MSNIYVDKLNEAITVLGGDPVTEPAGNVYVAKLDEVIAILTELRDQIARDRSAIFNNDGNPHTTNTDFNNLPDTYGTHFVGNGAGTTPVTNGPTTAQYYGFTLGLGTPHEPSAYSSQIYWPRTGSPYLNVRFRENGSFTTWSKVHAGYADTAGNSTTTSQEKFPDLNVGSAVGATTGQIRTSGTINGIDSRVLQSYVSVASGSCIDVGMSGLGFLIVNCRNPSVWPYFNSGYLSVGFDGYNGNIALFAQSVAPGTNVSMYIGGSTGLVLAKIFGVGLRITNNFAHALSVSVASFMF